MADNINSVAELALRVSRDADLAQRISSDPVKALAQVAQPTPLQTDVLIYRIVVIALSTIVLIGMVGGIAAGFNVSAKLPDFVTALASTALGALAGLLAPSPMAK